jgi:hypothetical protein
LGSSVAVWPVKGGTATVPEGNASVGGAAAVVVAAAPGAFDGSLIGSEAAPCAKAALFRPNNVRPAATHARRALRFWLRDPPSVFMLHNPFFVA